MNIYVGNLSRSASEEQLRELFEQYGQVTSVKIIKDKFTGDPRGFAFVEMASSDEANQSIAELDGKDFEGQSIRVNEARPREARPRGGSQGGGGSRGGFGGGGGGYRGRSKY